MRSDGFIRAEFVVKYIRNHTKGVNFMNKRLYGKTVIITGASGGIGFNVAKILIEKYDCKVLGIARNEEKLLAAKNSLKDKAENFSFVAFDVTDRDKWKEFKEYLQNNGIFPDILINNAGFMLPFSKFEKYSEEEIDEIIKTDFVSVVVATKTLLPLIKKSDSPAIINVSSAAGLCPVVGESMYCAVKYAVRGFTETLIQDYKKQIYVAGVYPGFIRTNILHRMSVVDKENKLIQKLMMPAEKAAAKIVRGMRKKKNRIVMGADGRSMSFFGRIMPGITPSLVTSVLRKSKLELFGEVFNDDINTKKDDINTKKGD